MAQCRTARALLSLDKCEARRRVLSLYRAWYRLLPWVSRRYDAPKTLKEIRLKLKEQFLAHKHLEDIRVIDLLVIRGHMFYREIDQLWAQNGHLMRFYKEGPNPRPKGFKKRFLEGLW